MKLNLFLLPLFTFTGAIFAQTPERICIKKNETYILELEANLTTGYRWSIKSPTCTHGIDIKELDFMLKQPVSVGSGCMQRWEITPKIPDTLTTLTFEYKCMWEPAKVAQVKTFVISVLPS